MSFQAVGACLLACAALVSAAPAAPGAAAGAPPRSDLHGDPLPEGAAARLGTTRFRVRADALAYSPGGRLVATCAPSGVALWDAATGRKVRTLVDAWPVTSTAVVFSPDGEAVSAAGGTRLARWDVASGEKLLDRRLFDPEAMGERAAWRAAFGAGDARLAVSGSKARAQREAESFTPAGGFVTVLDTRSGKTLIDLTEFSIHVKDVALSPDGGTLAFAYPGSTVHVWDLAEGRERYKIDTGRLGDGTHLAFSPDGRLLSCNVRTRRPAGLSASERDAWPGESRRRLYEAATGGAERDLAPCHGPSTFSPDGRLIASVTSGPRVSIWDAARGVRLSVLGKPVERRSFRVSGRWGAELGTNALVFRSEHWGPGVTAAAFSPDSLAVAVACRDGAVHTFRVRPAGGRGHAGPVTAVAFSKNGRRIASAGDDGTIRVWNAGTGEEVRAISARTRKVLALSSWTLDPYGLAWAGANGAVWRSRPGREELLQLEGKVYAVSFARDTGALAVDVEVEKRTPRWALQVWASNAELVGSISHDRGFRKLALMPDGRHVAVENAKNEIMFWHVRTAEEKWRAGLGGSAYYIAPSFDGKTIAVNVDGRRVVLLDSLSGRRVSKDIRAAGSRFTRSSFTPDGKTILAACGKTLEAYSVETGRRVATFGSHGDTVTCLAVSPDGTRAVTGSWDSSLLVWDLARLLPAGRGGEAPAGK